MYSSFICQAVKVKIMASRPNTIICYIYKGTVYLGINFSNTGKLSVWGSSRENVLGVL